MNYIKIISQYFKESLVRDIDQQWRSLESALSESGREYEFNDTEGFATVVVSDKNDAILLGNQLGLQAVKYIPSAGESIVIELIAPKNTGRPKNTVFIKNQGKGMTIRQYQKHLKATTISKAGLVKRGILTKKQLDEAIVTGKLQIINVGTSQRISQESLINFL